MMTNVEKPQSRPLITKKSGGKYKTFDAIKVRKDMEEYGAEPLYHVDLYIV